VISKTMTPKEVAAKYNINSNNIRKFTYRKRSPTKQNCDKKGRSPILNNEVFNEIKGRYQYSVPSLTFNTLSEFKEDLKKYILRAALISKQRQSAEANLTINKKKCISLSTLNRRVKEFTALFINFVIINNKL